MYCTDPAVGVVYLLHFDAPYKHARHYTGWTEDLIERLSCHASGKGARLMTVIWQAGIGFILVRTCEGTRRTERAIKNAGGAVRYCPLCTSRPWNGHWGPVPADLVPRHYPNQPAGRPRWILLPASTQPGLAASQARPCGPALGGTPVRKAATALRAAGGKP